MVFGETVCAFEVGFLLEPYGGAPHADRACNSFYSAAGGLIRPSLGGLAGTPNVPARRRAGWTAGNNVLVDDWSAGSSPDAARRRQKVFSKKKRIR